MCLEVLLGELYLSIIIPDAPLPASCDVATGLALPAPPPPLPVNSTPFSPSLLSPPLPPILSLNPVPNPPKLLTPVV